MKREGITYTADEYSRTKKDSQFRDDVELYTIFTLIGDPTGLRILDAGCGDGIYARELVDHDALHVIGVDCAEDFIGLARKKNESYEGRIEYHHAFIQDFLGKSDRDLVVGSFVLSYPRSLEEATAYCKAMASHLKIGGRFIGFNNNPFEIYEGERYSKYGFRKVMKSDEEGAEVIYWIDGMSDPIINFFLRPESYERAFREAGFSNFQWIRVLLNPSEKNNPYWEDFFKDEPPFIAMVAKK